MAGQAYIRRGRQSRSRAAMGSAKRTRTIVAAASMLVSLPSPSTSFNTHLASSYSRSQLPRQPLTQIGFRQEQDFELPTMAPMERELLQSLFSDSTALPPWLSPTAYSAEEKLSSLKLALERSDLTADEASRVLLAVNMASEGDRNRLAGAAEFCALLVDTMEMGQAALVAAAFHFSSCVSARENVRKNGIGFWDAPEMSTSLDSFGEEAIKIAGDAGRLKRTETLAASVVEKTNDRCLRDSGYAANLRSLLLSETGDWRALAIRSAASLFRLRGLLSHRQRTNSQSLSREDVTTAREALHVYAPLASRLGMHRLKNELEGAAFRLLYRRQHAAVMSLYDRNEMEPILDHITESMREMLGNNEALKEHARQVKVSARVKEPYSLWKKMLSTGARSAMDVPDAIALRVILDGKKDDPNEDAEITAAKERGMCYFVQQLCTDRWTPSENPRFKDYIERPKANGYQSLHYSASQPWEGQIRPFEIQVRSGEMHRVAEFGLAAHWDYKINSSEDVDNHHIDCSTDSYLKSVQAWHWQQTQGTHDLFEQSLSACAENCNEKEERKRATAERLAPYIDALKAARCDIEREQVFVFLATSLDENRAGGRLLSLPSGACVLDALREVEKQYGVDLHFLREDDKWGNCLGMLHNGVTSSVTQRLRNGDVLSMAS